MPPRLLLVGAIGLLGLALFQALPVGSTGVELISPRALEIHAATRPPSEALAAEQRLLGLDPAGLEQPPALSVDPGSTASALRTGAALLVLLVVGCTVAALRGARVVAMALLFSASFQGLYGLLILISGHDRLWHLPKLHYLDSATGTFVNRNHFACFLAMSLAVGFGLILDNLRRQRRAPGQGGLVRWLSGDGSRNLLLGLLALLGLAGLLASFSRAGIALGLFALGLTVVAGGRSHRMMTRAVAIVLIVAAAAVPLIQIGADRLWGRYANSAVEISQSGGRLQVWNDTLTMAEAFPVVGSGFGTFAVAYPIYRSPDIRLFYRHAHNDVLQVLAEGGLIGAALALLILVPLLGIVVASAAGNKGALGVGLAAGLTALLLHSLIDFNLHIPANAATAAILAGMLCGLPWKRRS